MEHMNKGTMPEAVVPTGSSKSMKKATGAEKKLRQEIEQEVAMTLTQDFMVQVTSLRVQIENQKKRHEDQLYDKDAEIDTIQKTISTKDAKIKEL